MAIETDLATIKILIGCIADANERIANALEAMLSERGYVPDAPRPASPTPKQLDLVDEAAYIEEEEAAAPVEKKAAKKKAKKKAKTETVVGKPDDKDEVVWTLPGIRAELHKLQEQENQAAVKSVLKKFGASTLGQLDIKKYAALAAAVAEQLE